MFQKIHCPHCSTRLQGQGRDGVLPRHAGATLVAPGHDKVIPLEPEFIVPQDGAEKQDCENGGQALAAAHGARYAELEADLSRRRSVLAPAALRGGAGDRRPFHLRMQAIVPSADRGVLTGIGLPIVEQTVKRGKQRVVHRYRWLYDVPLRDGADALTVNWFEIEIINARGKTTYRNSFVTDLPVGCRQRRRTRRLRPGQMEDRERNLQRSQEQRL